MKPAHRGRVKVPRVSIEARSTTCNYICYLPDKDKNPYNDDYRQECYLKYLVPGTLFASANRWIVAQQHAESAIKIVERAKALLHILQGWHNSIPSP
jgi:hypothetical protein